MKTEKYIGLDKVEDELLGSKGTPARDAYETELATELKELGNAAAGNKAAINQLAAAIDPNGYAEKIEALIKPMPDREQDIVLNALRAGATLQSVAEALETLTSNGNPAHMAQFLDNLERQTAKKKKPKGSKFTPGKKKRKKKSKR